MLKRPNSRRLLSMLRSNRLTWFAGLMVLVAFGTLLYAVDYGTYLQGRFKGHVENSFGNLHPTTHRISPPIVYRSTFVHHVEKPVEEWDSPRFLKGHPTKLFRGVLIPSAGVVARCLIHLRADNLLENQSYITCWAIEAAGFSTFSVFISLAWALTFNY
jgi:hypothetical protein